MSVHQRSSFRRVSAESKSVLSNGSLGGLLAAILVLGSLRLAVAQDKPVVTIRPAPPRSTRPAPPAPAPRATAPTPATHTSQQAASPERRSRRRVAAARVRRWTRTHAVAEPRVAVTIPQQPERRVRTARRQKQTHVATRRSEPVKPDVASAPPSRETSRIATRSRRRVRSRVAGYQETRQAQDSPVSDGTDTAPSRRRHSRREQASARSDSDSSAAAGGGKGAASLNAIGFRLIRQHRYAEAEPYLRRAVAQDPNYAYAQYNLGCSLLAQGKASQALGPLQHSAAQQPERWEPQDKLAEAYRRLDDGDRAAAASSRAKHLRRHHRSGHALPSVGPRTAQAVPVRAAVDSGSWRGSTDRKEERYLTEWRGMR